MCFCYCFTLVDTCSVLLRLVSPADIAGCPLPTTPLPAFTRRCLYSPGGRTQCQPVWWQCHHYHVRQDVLVHSGFIDIGILVVTRQPFMPGSVPSSACHCITPIPRRFCMIPCSCSIYTVDTTIHRCWVGLPLPFITYPLGCAHHTAFPFTTPDAPAYLYPTTPALVPTCPCTVPATTPILGWDTVSAPLPYSRCILPPHPPAPHTAPFTTPVPNACRTDSWTPVQATPPTRRTRASALLLATTPFACHPVLSPPPTACRRTVAIQLPAILSPAVFSVLTSTCASCFWMHAMPGSGPGLTCYCLCAFCGLFCWKEGPIAVV